MGVLRGLGPAVVAVLVVEGVVAGVFIAARYLTRVFMRGSPGWDDFTLMFTWVLQMSFVGMSIAACTQGMGAHSSDLTIEMFARAVKLELVAQFLVSIAMGTSKVGVSLFLMRIVTNKWHKAILWFWNVSIMTLSIFLAISVYAQCQPVKSIWDPRIRKEVCPLNLTIIATVMCSWSAAMDFFLALFPWYVLRNLNMKRRERITICASLSLGIFAGTCGVIRTTGLDALSKTSDYLYETSPSVMWTSSEMTLTIICVSVPALRPLWKGLSTRGFSSSGGYQQYHDGSGQNDVPIEFRNLPTSDKQHGYEASAARSPAKADDNDSDTCILEHGNGRMGGIHRKQDIELVYEEEVAATTSRQHL
ncbi:hypothetical protein EV356DRAFT_529846 [Viridothelium virens]|uniref:Rhodopsin domain-containing protein n=1 Tax=Viridothelium virens TaxID=1048519 RepID=A0A6A6HI51_VIRVR|nr:hypothetical protein EV356DRAFT_529846 [Viridothelium virens]